MTKAPIFLSARVEKTITDAAKRLATVKSIHRTAPDIPANLRKRTEADLP